jgi:uridine kinase
MSALQYERDVLPMHTRYIEPVKKDADIILSSSAETDRLMPLLRAALAKRSAGNRTDTTRVP